MKKLLALLLIGSLQFAAISAQEPPADRQSKPGSSEQPTPTPDDIENDFHPASTNQPGQEYSQGIDGLWHAQFETPFGVQTYHFQFGTKADGTQVGTAVVEAGDDRREVDFINVEFDDDEVSFSEVRTRGDREFRTDYRGKLKNGAIELTRTMGNFGTQQLLATRFRPKPLPEPPPVPVVDIKIDRVIKDVFAESFRIGLAGDVPTGYSPEELELAAKHFNAVTPENCMKPERVHPAADRWQFERPDALVEWAQQNQQSIHGHTLVWHAQTPDWFFEGGDKEVITNRMRNHIHTLVGRYKGKIQSWDVVNEAIDDGGDALTGQTENLRNSKWRQLLGEDYLTLAFQFAHEADPEAILYYNDYNIESGPKHESSMVLLKRLLAAGAPVHAVGIQGHWRAGRVPFDDIERAIADYASLGLKVSITELDVTIRGESGGQFGGGFGRRSRSTPVTVEDLHDQATAYAKLFEIFQKYDADIQRVTFWGLNDRRTWRRGQHPLLFDALNNLKPAYAAIVESVK